MNRLIISYTSATNKSKVSFIIISCFNLKISCFRHLTKMIQLKAVSTAHFIIDLKNHHRFINTKDDEHAQISVICFITYDFRKHLIFFIPKGTTKWKLLWHQILSLNIWNFFKKSILIAKLYIWSCFCIKNLTLT